jgi:molybdenum cofactor synthesis domain-containing protein
VFSLKPSKRTHQRILDDGRPAPKVRPQRDGPFYVELIVVGRELLRGHVADRNSRAIAERMSRRGGLVHRISVVDDNERAVAAALREALDRNPHLVITTGGLGPAPDDVTLAGVAKTLGQPLKMNPPARAMVEAAYQRLAQAKQVRSSALTLAREKMCWIPVNGEPVPNERGIPPGVVCRLPGGAAVICLPGAPGEALEVLEAALPLLRDLPPRTHTARREVEAPSPDESLLRPMLEQISGEFPGLWVSSRPLTGAKRKATVVVTLEATASTEDEANAVLAGAVRRLLALAGGSR